MRAAHFALLISLASYHCIERPHGIIHDSTLMRQKEFIVHFEDTISSFESVIHINIFISPIPPFFVLLWCGDKFVS